MTQIITIKDDPRDSKVIPVHTYMADVTVFENGKRHIKPKSQEMVQYWHLFWGLNNNIVRISCTLAIENYQILLKRRRYEEVHNE